MSNITAPDGSAPSALSFGTMQFGGKADEAASRDLFRACRERGVNMFDTAYVYTEGRSEEILGGLIQKERDKLIIATKADFARGNGAESITESCQESRARSAMQAASLVPCPYP